MEGKPALKTLEVEISRQVQFLHSYFERNMDLLHEQIHNEIYNALSQELVSVAQNLTSIRMEAHNSIDELRNSSGVLDQNVGMLTTVVERMREELTSTKVHAEGVKSIQGDMELLREGLHASLTRAESMMKEEVAGLRTELQAAFAETQAALAERPAVSNEIPQEFAKRIVDLETKLPQMESATKEALGAEAAERATRAGELAMSVELSRAEARQIAEKMEASISALAAEAEARTLDAEAKFRKTADSLAFDIEKSRKDTRSAELAAESTARANLAVEQMSTKCEALETRVGSLVREVELQFDDARKDIRQLSTDCSDGFGFAYNCWTRTVDWMASVDLQELERAGRFDLESPEFMAAGLRGLRLVLRLVTVEKPGGKLRWTCGAFLRGSMGQVSFRLHAAGKSQSFAGDFANTPEWGSQRIVTLEMVGPSVPVRLEILDVTAEVPPQIGAPEELIATLQMTDAARVATREADKVKSMMVKRIEWRVVRVSERIAAARAAVAAGKAEEEALEPLLSPLFSAGGLEGMQLQLFPLGYLRRDDQMPSSNYEEKCGFFLVCPRGVYLKCRAFVGDQVKIFEHQYTDREPFGRANFCRLIDKAGNDDCVVCGIEILDVRQELTTQVKGGPFGSVVDQMKVTLAPSLGSMEVMRELRDASDKPARGDRDAGARAARRAQPAGPAPGAYPTIIATAMAAPLGPTMVLPNGQTLSLPDLAIHPSSKAAPGPGGGHGQREGSWPPSPGSPAKQRMRLPKI
jgi:hypothetical protein